jgi:ATP-dependent DNA helicase RecG
MIDAAARSYVQHLLSEPDTHRREAMQTPDLEHLGRTMCAFLNGPGGVIMIGVSPEGEVVGVDEPDQFIEAARDELAVSVQPLAPWSFNVVRDGEHDVVLAEVPSGPRPPYLWKNVIFTRRGAATRPASPDEISAMIHARQRAGERWERLPALGAQFADLDDGAIRETIQSARQRFGRALPDDSRGALEELGLITPGDVRNSALVLFGRNPARWYPQMRLRLAAFRGEEREAFLDNRFEEGNLFELFQAADRFVTRNIQVEAQMPTQTMVREDRPRFPFAAVREGILNALVHRDYAAFDGRLSVAIFDDRIEIENSGTFPQGIHPNEEYGDYVSRPVNPDIAHVFMLRGLIEHWGIGIRRIIEECERAGLPRPTWDVGHGRVLLTIRAASSKRAARDLNERQLELLRDLAIGQSIDAGTYHKKYAAGVSDRQARTDLVQLAQFGYLTRIGSGNRVAYLRTPKTIR